MGQDGVGPLRRSQAPPLRLVPVTRPRRCSIGRRSCPGPPGSAAFPSAGPARTSLSVPPVRPLGHGPHRSVTTMTWVSRQYFARSVRWSTERAMSPRHTSARRTIRPPEVAWLTHPRSCHRALARIKESTHRLSMRPSVRGSPSGTGANVLPDQNGLTRAQPVGLDATGSRDLTDLCCSGLSSQVRASAGRILAAAWKDTLVRP